MGNREIIEDLRCAMNAIGIGGIHSTQGDGDDKNTLFSEDARPIPAQASKPASSQDDHRKDALSKIVALINASEKSAKSIRERLIRDGYSEVETDEAIERACEYGIVDDERFAAILIRSRIAQGKGSAGIERELVKNGIDPSQVDGWPYDYAVDHESELTRALEGLERKPPRSKNVREAAFRRTISKGFPTAVATSAARIWSERVTS